MRNARDFLIVLLLGGVALIVIDRIWFTGHYLQRAEQELGVDISAIRHR